MKKLSEMELEREELSTKADKANQTIGALRFENNFLAEKTKQDDELFQVRAQLEWALSAKLDEILSIQKTASDKSSLGHVPSFSTYDTSSSASHGIIFVPLANTDISKNNESKIELESEVHNDKGKFILGERPKIIKNENK